MAVGHILIFSLSGCLVPGQPNQGSQCFRVGIVLRAARRASEDPRLRLLVGNHESYLTEALETRLIEGFRV